MQSVVDKTEEHREQPEQMNTDPSTGTTVGDRETGVQTYGMGKADKVRYGGSQFSEPELTSCPGHNRCQTTRETGCGSQPRSAE